MVWDENGLEEGGGCDSEDDKLTMSWVKKNFGHALRIFRTNDKDPIKGKKVEGLWASRLYPSLCPFLHSS